MAEKENWETKERDYVSVNINISCDCCGNIGAGKLSNIGPGGTVPWVCPACGNSGLADFGGLEGYKKGFTSLNRL